jgi:hypothetical protein
MTRANLEHYTNGYERNLRADTNIDIDPKTHYVFKAYSQHLQATLAEMAGKPALVS